MGKTYKDRRSWEHKQEKTDYVDRKYRLEEDSKPRRNSYYELIEEELEIYDDANIDDE